MSIYAQVAGTLYRPVEQHVSASGETAVQGVIRIQQKLRSGEAETLYCSLVALSEVTRNALLDMKVGDRIAAGGQLAVGVREREGRFFPTLSMVVDTVSKSRSSAGFGPPQGLW